jgi:glycerol-3-phosphate dehydrogenase (NAD(P)+)
LDKNISFEVNLVNISVVGGGTFGTTLAWLLGSKYPIRFWVRENDLAEGIEKTRENRNYLPGVTIPDQVQVSSDLEKVVPDSDVLICAIPSQYLRSVAKQFSTFVKEGAILIDVAKGLELNTGKRMSQVLEEEIPQPTRIVAVSGPTFAKELSKGLLTAAVAASVDKEASKITKEVMENHFFKVYPMDDIIGVEVCGAVKNIVAIASGASFGLGMGYNAFGALITLGLNEMKRIGLALGAKYSTFYSLAGIGDLVATANSKQSRNRFFGNSLAQGKSVEQINREMKGMVAEGVDTSKVVYELCEREGIDAPLTQKVYEIIHRGKPIQQVLRDLLKEV